VLAYGEPHTRAAIQLLVAEGRTVDALIHATAVADRMLADQRLSDAVELLDTIVPQLLHATDVPADVLGPAALRYANCLMLVRPLDEDIGRSLARAAEVAHSPAVRARVALARARLQWVVGHLDRCGGLLETAWTEATTAAQPQLSANIATHQVGLQLAQGHVAAAERWLAEVRAATAESDVPAAMAHQLVVDARVALARGDIALAEQAAAAGMARFEDLHASRGAWSAIQHWVRALRMQGRFSEAAAPLKRYLVAARRSQSRSAYVQLLISAAWLDSDLCRLGLAQEWLDEVEATIHTGERLDLRLDAGLVRGRVFLVSGQLREAEDSLSHVHRLASSTGLLAPSELARAWRAEAWWYMGREDEARADFEAAVMGLERSGDAASLAEGCAARARALGAEVDPEVLFGPAAALMDTGAAPLLSLEAGIARATWHAARGEDEEAGLCWLAAAGAINEVAARLNDSDRAALRVHPWSRRVRRGMT
jgi:tetratricopeptide (TPR) repeat protein